MARSHYFFFQHADEQDVHLGRLILGLNARFGSRHIIGFEADNADELAALVKTIGAMRHPRRKVRSVLVYLTEQTRQQVLDRASALYQLLAAFHHQAIPLYMCIAPGQCRLQESEPAEDMRWLAANVPFYPLLYAKPGAVLARQIAHDERRAWLHLLLGALWLAAVIGLLAALLVPTLMYGAIVAVCAGGVLFVAILAAWLERRRVAFYLSATCLIGTAALYRFFGLTRVNTLWHNIISFQRTLTLYSITLALIQIALLLIPVAALCLSARYERYRWNVVVPQAQGVQSPLAILCDERDLTENTRLLFHALSDRVGYRPITLYDTVAADLPAHLTNAHSLLVVVGTQMLRAMNGDQREIFTRVIDVITTHKILLVPLLTKAAVGPMRDMAGHPILAPLLKCSGWVEEKTDTEHFVDNFAGELTFRKIPGLAFDSNIDLPTMEHYFTHLLDVHRGLPTIARFVHVYRTVNRALDGAINEFFFYLFVVCAVPPLVIVLAFFFLPFEIMIAVLIAYLFTFAAYFSYWLLRKQDYTDLTAFLGTFLLFVLASKLLNLRAILFTICVQHHFPSPLAFGALLIEVVLFYLTHDAAVATLHRVWGPFANFAGALFTAWQKAEAVSGKHEDATDSSSSTTDSETYNAIFLSYRRDDTRDVAAKLNRLLARRGVAFYDFESIPPGTDFEQVITQAIAHCTAFMVLLGSKWLASRDEQGHRRLDDPSDFVRSEIRQALQAQIAIYVLLVDDVQPPSRTEVPDDIGALADCPVHRIRRRHARIDFLSFLIKA